MSDHKQAAQIYFQEGKLLKQQGDLERAAGYFRSAIRLQPDFAAAHNNLGNTLQALGKLDEAVACFQEAIRLKPNLAVAHCNLAAVRQMRGEVDAAIAGCLEAIRLQPDFVLAYGNLGKLFVSQGRMGEAERCYRQSLAIKPDWAEAHFELGNLYWRQKRVEEAISCFRAAIRSQRDFAAAYNGLGVALQSRGDMDLAEVAFRKALKLQPDLAEAHGNLGTLLEFQGKLEEAFSCMQRAIALKPDAIDVFYRFSLLHLRLCDWRGYDERVRELISRTEAHVNSEKQVGLSPLTLNFFPVPVALHAAAGTYCAKLLSQSASEAKRRLSQFKSQLKKPSAATPAKLRVGYVSPDFRSHPVGFLIHEIFQHHSRDEFEVYGYYLVDKEDEITRSVRAGCNVFADISRMSSEDAARRIIADGIHILVDLAGYTTHSRPEIFALQPAPIQCVYLGYPDTMGGEFIQYMIGDKWLISEELAGCCAEKVAYLPHGFVASHVGISQREMARAEFGLPADAAVFCSFNRHEKIDPQVFDVWARILLQVPGSVLWLSESAPASNENLRREAVKRGVAANRLVFSKNMPVAEYLARYRLADLFLDTFVYNGGATAAGALQAGLPVLTLPGNTYVSRMGASVCAAALLPEMICTSREEYERRAVHLGNNPVELAAIRRKLAENSSSAPLFNTRQFVRHLEDAFRNMWDTQKPGF
ncbi:MAG: tetratricopeptide repeat protein [Oscillatoria princeps RMCB-10]|jgi:predicted O-linked N-acetylglucosamine transferase (SPINDLY family)|nr:tetratricopeptide repeat protein [Oscillatoria princeps RMCB-10]